jgi:hypothetical protein
MRTAALDEVDVSLLDRNVVSSVDRAAVLIGFSGGAGVPGLRGR